MNETSNGDFWSLLKKSGYQLGSSVRVAEALSPEQLQIAHGTTILAFKYAGGVVVAGDRRATAGTSVMYDRTDKVVDIDRFSVLAIAGVPATAFEIARIMEHTFKYFRRSQLQELSLDGKVRALSRLLRENVPMAIQGIGAVAPLYAVYDPERKEGKIFFYDILGAEFEGVEFAVSGSGSPAVRGILHYENRWGAKPLSRIGEEEALLLSMRLLETASEFDSATGGIKADTRLFPLIKLVTPDGCRTVPANELERLYSADTGKHNPGGSND